MRLDLSHFSVPARNVVVIADKIKTLRGKRDIDDVDLAIAASAVESPAIDSLQKLGTGFFSLCKKSGIKPTEVITTVGRSFNSELPIPELDDYEDFTPSGSFVVHWASNLARNNALRIAKGRAYDMAKKRLGERKFLETTTSPLLPKWFRLLWSSMFHSNENIVINAEDAVREVHSEDVIINPSDLNVQPEHILFIALAQRGATPSKLVESVYKGVDLDPAKTIRESLGFQSSHITAT